MPFRNVSVIIEGRLFLGKSVLRLRPETSPPPHLTLSPSSLVAAQSTRSLTERRITHIVSVCTDPIPAEHVQSGIQHMRVPVRDDPYEDLLIHMPRTCSWIDSALRSGGVVLVHGTHGLSRGATIMAAYRMALVSPHPSPSHDPLSHQ